MPVDVEIVQNLFQLRLRSCCQLLAKIAGRAEEDDAILPTGEGKAAEPKHDLAAHNAWMKRDGLRRRCDDRIEFAGSSIEKKFAVATRDEPVVAIHKCS